MRIKIYRSLICCRGIGEHSSGAVRHHFHPAGIHCARFVLAADREYLRVRGQVALLRCEMGEEYTLLPAGKLWFLLIEDTMRYASLGNTSPLSPLQAPLQGPDYSFGRIVERAFRADSGAMELLRGRDHLGTCGPAVGTKGSSCRQSEEAEGTLSEMRRSEGRSFRVCVFESHSPLQGGWATLFIP